MAQHNRSLNKTVSLAGLLVCFLTIILGTAQTEFDLVLQGGHVIDPRNGINEVRDVGIRNGVIKAVEASIPAGKALESIDLSGLYLTPGLVDIHTHLYHTTGIPDAWAGDNSVEPDSFSFRTGVTAMVDAGSAGWRNFEDFRQSVIDRAKTRVFALINIAGFGMISDMVEQGDFNPEEVARLAIKHKNVVVGIKAAHYQKQDWQSVDQAVAAGRSAGVPIMVDFGYFLPERPFWELVGSHLRTGDIATHMFRGPVPWLNRDGEVYSYLYSARDRGVVFDVGHGGGSFVLRNAVPAIKQGFYPDTISTDLHSGSRNGAMIDMPTTMSKFLAMGMPLQAVVAASTWKPASVIQRQTLGHLSLNAKADIAVWALREGRFGFGDPYRGRINGTRRLQCEMTLLEGEIVWDWNARAAQDYERLEPGYGVRDVDSLLQAP